MPDEKYQLSLTGAQIDDALLQMANRVPEGWAVGTKDGVAVPSTSQYYHNNAKYYAEQAAASAASIDAGEMNRRILASFPTATETGGLIAVSDGADGIPVKAISAALGNAIYVVAPNVFLGASSPYAVARYEAERQRCVVFPCAASTQYTVTSAITATMRIASFHAFPAVGDAPTQFATAAANSVSLTTGASDKWILAQMFIDSNASATLAAALGAGFGISPAPVWESVPVRRVGKNLLDESVLLAGDWNTSGGISHTSNEALKHSPLFPVVGGAGYVFSNSVAYSDNRRIAFFDEKCSFLSYEPIAGGAASKVFTAPANAAFASVSIYNVAGQQTQFERGGVVTPWQAFDADDVEIMLADGSMSDELTTALGNNDISANVGTLTVTYRADPTIFINSKTNAIMAVIAAL